MKQSALFLLIAAAVFLSACRPSPQKLIATANKYHDAKKYKEADILYAKVIAKDKTNEEAYYREGLNLISQGNIGGAAQYLRRAVDLKPWNPDAVTRLAEIYTTAYLTNSDKFRSLLPEINDLKTKLLQHDPNSFEGIRLDGIINLAQNRIPDALSDFERANNIKPYSRQLVGWYAETLARANQPEKAESIVRQTLSRDKTWGPGYAFLYSAAIQRKDLNGAEQILREHVQADPSDTGARVVLARFLTQTNRAPAAEAVLKEMVADRTRFPNAREILGDFYVGMRRFDDAIAQFNQGAIEDPKQALHLKEQVAVAESNANRNADAIQLLKSLVAQNPNDAEVNEKYASMLVAQGSQANLKDSLSELKSLTQKNPTNPRLHLDLSQAYLAVQDLDSALKETEEAITLESKQQNRRPEVLLPAHVYEAKIYEAKGQHAQALEQAQQALQLSPSFVEARLLRDQALLALHESDQAQPDLEKLVSEADAAKNHGVDANQARLLLANLYVSQRQFAKASDLDKAVADGPPPDLRGFLNLQAIAIMQGKGEQALTAIAALVNKTPDGPQTTPLRYDLANTQVDVAAQEYRTNPKRASELLNQAEDNYKAILKTQGSASEIWIRLAAVQRQLGQLDAAIASLQQDINVNPKDGRAMSDCGTLFEALGRPKEAEDMYNRALGVDPDNVVALNNLAFLNAKERANLEQAQSYAERAKKRAPNSPDISDTLGYVYYQRDLNTAALQIFRQNVQDHPQNAMFHLHYGMALLKQGDRASAKQQADQALKLATPAQQNEIKSFASQIG